MQAKRVVIVGGGMAGLACAADLAEAGVKVTVLEKRPVAGGKVSSWNDQDGDPIESGLHIFFGCYKKLFPFLKRVGAYQHINWKEHTILVAQANGKTHRLHFPNIPAPFSGIVAFSWNKLFTLSEKLTNIPGLFVVYVRGLGYNKKLDRFSYAQWHKRRWMQQSVVDKLWNAISLSTGFIGADEMSARPMTTVFHYFARSTNASKLGFLNGTPERQIFEPIRHYLEERGGEILLNQKVKEVVVGEDELAKGLLMEDGSLIEADAYIIAAPLHSARQLLPDKLRRYKFFDNLWKLRSVPVMNAQIWYDRKISEEDNLFFTSEAIFSVFADLSITSPKAYDKHGGSLVSMAIAPAAPLWQLSDEEILDKAHADLVKLWPKVVEAKRLKGSLVRIPNSIYREEPGSDKYRPTQFTPIPNLFLSGCYTAQDYMASMEGAVQSGQLAAKAVLKSFS